MKLLWVFAHPEPNSLNGALRNAGCDRLHQLNHHVRCSDLYAMGWKAVADGTDIRDRDPTTPLRYGHDTEQAHRTGNLSPDIRQEQRKLRWADTVVIQFPLWWYSAPAILKGWFDRVLTKGFAYGIPDPARPGHTVRYGDGPLAGKRAMLIVTAGGREAALGPRGVHGFINHLLFPIQHGTLWYTGISVIQPLVFYGANHVDDEEFTGMTKHLHARLDTLDVAKPIAYRKQSAGDYDDDLVLKPDLASGRNGPDIHLLVSPTTY